MAQTLFTWGPANVDSLLTLTKSVVSKLPKDLLNDAIFSKITLLNWLKSKSQTTQQGGASILIPLLYGKNSTFAAYSGTDIIDTGVQEGMTMALFGPLAVYA